MQSNWIPHPTILKGEQIELHPLEKDHFEPLFSAAADEELWRLIPTDCSKRDVFDQAYNVALKERDKGNQYPFVIYHKESKELIGSTRLFEIFPNDKKLEIGWTWLIKKYWGTSINLECKLLLLTHCFEVLKTRRVQLKTDVINLRSRKAIEKTGAEFEGILRKDRIKANGESRSAAYYSIIDDEWEFAKAKIRSQLQEKGGG
jgi:RimJ/RimL family protein N-acetyltransferase